MGVDADERGARLQDAAGFRERAAHQILVVRVRLLRIPAVLARLGDRLPPLRRRGQGEVLGVEVADDAFQPHVEERRQIRIVDAAVVGRIGDHRVEGLVVVEQLLRVAAGDDRRIAGADLGELADAVCLPVQREGEATRGILEAIDFRKIVEHLQRLAIADGSQGSLNGGFPPREFVERDDQPPERHREPSRERPRPIRGHARVAHLGMNLPDVLDEGEQNQQLPGREQLAIRTHPIVRKLVAEFPLKRFVRTLTVKFPFKSTKTFLDRVSRGRRSRRGRIQIQLRPLAVHNHGGKRFLHPSSDRHFLDVIGRCRGIARDADRLSRAGLLLLPGDVAGV